MSIFPSWWTILSHHWNYYIFTKECELEIQCKYIEHVTILFVSSSTHHFKLTYTCLQIYTLLANFIWTKNKNEIKLYLCAYLLVLPDWIIKRAREGHLAEKATNEWSVWKLVCRYRLGCLQTWETKCREQSQRILS